MDNPLREGGDPAQLCRKQEVCWAPALSGLVGGRAVETRMQAWGSERLSRSQAHAHSGAQNATSCGTRTSLAKQAQEVDALSLALVRCPAGQADTQVPPE